MFLQEFGSVDAQGQPLSPQCDKANPQKLSIPAGRIMWNVQINANTPNCDIDLYRVKRAIYGEIYEEDTSNPKY